MGKNSEITSCVGKQAEEARPLGRRLSPAELRWPLVFAAILIALTCLPYLFGWFITPPGYEYSGYLSNPDDHNVYLAYMRQAREGRLLFTDQFTTEPQKPWFFHSFFLTLGLFSRVSGLPLIWTYQLARGVCGMLLLISLYLFSAFFLEEARARRFFLLVVSLSSGFGWIYYLLLHPTGNQPHPPDFGPGVVMPELITFLTLLLNPLFCFSVFLLVSALGLFILAVERGSFRLAALAGVAGLLLANIHSYDLLPLGLTVLLYLAARGLSRHRFPARELAQAALMGVILLPALAYQFHLYRDLPVFRLKAEVATLSPPVQHYLLALGLPFLLSLPGMWIALRRGKTQPYLFLPLAWFAATLVSAYLPFPFQRKMAEGMQIPICLLAALFLSRWICQTCRVGRWAVAALVLVVSFPSNALYLRQVSVDLLTLGQRYYAALMPSPYLRQEQSQALAWLEKRVSSQDAILCNPLLGSYIPARTGAKTYMGHWAETLRQPHKLRLLILFLSGRMGLKERLELLRNEKITYVLIGPEEMQMAGGQAQFAGLPLKEVARAGEITIFQIEH